MDEPTNDLDIETLELLEEQILAYKGTLLLVSHDREFLDNVVTSTFVLDGSGTVGCFPGGYEDYLRQSSAPPSAAAADVQPAKMPKKVNIEIKKRPLPFAKDKKAEFKCNPFDIL